MSAMLSWAGRRVVLIAFFAAAGVSHAKPSGLDDVPAFQGMRARWAGVIDEFDVPGMAVAIVKDGRILALDTFGVRAPGGKAPTSDTLYYLASITKTYLATAVCVLADDGKLTLDDPVKKHLPRFVLASGSAVSEEKVSVRDLLCHRAGLGEGGVIVTLDAFTGEITEDRYYGWLAKRESTGQVGYSNIHYTLLGRVVEAASGKPWRDYVEERVLKPAGLTRTTGYASRMYSDTDCATPMERVDDEWRECRLQKSDRTMHAAGGLGTSAHDAARWLILHMNDGEIDGRRVVSAARAREMRTLQAAFPKKEGHIRVMEGFGLGWQVGTFHGTRLCSHGGGYSGTATYYAMLPEKKSGFAILMNAGGTAGGLLDVIAVDILDRLIEGDEHVDVLEGYRKRLREQKRRFARLFLDMKAAMGKPVELTQPTSAYAGRFESAQLGALTVTPDGSRLKMVLGECLLDVAPAGANAFTVLGPTLNGASFKFAVSPNGDVRAVDLNLSDEGTFVFARSDPVLIIGKESFPYYPGVLVSLDKGQVITLPKRLEDLNAIDADLWIEPRDPEIASLTGATAKVLGAKHVGRDVHVALTTDTYEAIAHVPAHCTWLERLPMEAISKGKVFLVQSSSNRYYKVRIDAWDKGQGSPAERTAAGGKSETTDRGGGFMRLSFARIPKP